MAWSSLCSRSESAGSEGDGGEIGGRFMARSTRVKASSCSRRCLRPRFKSPATAAVLRSRETLISAREQPCQ